MSHRVTLIPGDGIGPEITQAMVAVVESSGVDISWEHAIAGESAIAEHGTPLPDETIEAIRSTGLAIKGPVTTPVGTGFRSINVALRRTFDLYINQRPTRTFVPNGRYADIDLVVFRENTEDLYAGIEFEAGSQGAREIAALIEKLEAGTVREDAGISIKPISVFGSQRIVSAAFEYALAHGRKKITLIHKANIMKHTDGLFLAVGREIAAEYASAHPETPIVFEEMIVDAACMNLVIDPSRFDVLVLPNLYGDIVSDLCAGLVGGLGLAPGANISSEVAIFEAVHGSAPDIAGKQIANPTALILSAVMMLRHLGEADAAHRIEDAVARVYARGLVATSDIARQRNSQPGTHVESVSTAAFADAIIAEMKSVPTPADNSSQSDSIN